MKCGLEIHQRICRHKLFCNCNATGNKGELQKKFTRYMHAVAGETGEVDKTVRFEAIKSNKFTYESFDNTSCLIETDSEPPLKLNEEALITALSIAKHLKMFIPSELHVMRKTVIDGSNTGGFQRTIIIGLGTDKSVIKTSEGSVRIKDLELEEESARIIERWSGGTRYDLSGLGIPLIEVSTQPDIKSPEQAYEAALKLGELLRLTGRAQRGIGTIRQDINISVKGGARVEIKGFQDIRMIKRLIELEVKRQESLIALKSELTGYKLRKINVTEFFEKSKSKVVKGKKLVLSLIAPGFKELFKRKLNELKTLGSEIADYACAHRVKGLIHSDEDLNDYGLETEFIRMRNELGVKSNDLILIIAGDGSEVERAMRAVMDRIYLLNDCIPEETRTAKPDGTSSYARPLPGGERMYPETDIPLINPSGFIKRTFKIESKESRVKKLRRLGLPAHLINSLVLSQRLELFYLLIKSLKRLKPVLIAGVLIEAPKEVKKRFKHDTSVLRDKHFKDLLALLDKGLITRQAVIPLLNNLCAAPELSVKDLAGEFKAFSDAELKKLIKMVVKSNEGLKFKVLMGLVMKEVAGRADGSRVSRILKKIT